jgi:hypothetical protein
MQAWKARQEHLQRRRHRGYQPAGRSGSGRQQEEVVITKIDELQAAAARDLQS